MIAIATVLKIVPALLMGYLLLRRRWRALIVAVVVTVAVLLACLALVGWDNFYGLVPLLLTTGIGQDTLAHNQSLLGPILNGIATTNPDLAATLRPFQYVVLGALALAAGSVLWISWRREDQREHNAKHEAVADALADAPSSYCFPSPGRLLRLATNWRAAAAGNLHPRGGPCDRKEPACRADYPYRRRHPGRRADQLLPAKRHRS